MAYYPPLPPGTTKLLRILMANLLSDPTGYLGADCPYNDQDREALAQLLPASKVEKPDLQVDPDFLWAEARAIYLSLQDLGSAEDKLDPKEKMSLAKVRASLLEKLLSIQERATNLKNMERFQSVVLEHLDRVLTAEQRLAFLESLQ